MIETTFKGGRFFVNISTRGTDEVVWRLTKLIVILISLTKLPVT